MAPRTLRPYIRPSYKLNLQIGANTGPHAEKIINQLACFLQSIGFSRPKKKGKKPPETQATESTSTGCTQEEAKISDKYSLADLGLRSLLRLVEKKAKSNKGQEEKDDGGGDDILALMDSGLYGTTAVSHVFAVYSLSSRVLFYVVPGMSSTLGKSLNLKRCSTVVLHQRPETNRLWKSINATLKPITLIDKKQSKQDAKAENGISFKEPILAMPIGKSPAKKRKKKKKRIF